VLLAYKETGMVSYSINYSLGVWGNKKRLSDEDFLSITTMCGHYMIPREFVDDVLAQATPGKLRPRKEP
jgi:hypothetical protein